MTSGQRAIAHLIAASVIIGGIALFCQTLTKPENYIYYGEPGR